MLKKFKNNSYMNYFLKLIFYTFIRIILISYKLEIHVSKRLNQNFNKNCGIFYFWHQNILASLAFFYKSKSTGACIISPSKDGQILGYAIKKLGFDVIYGSSNKNYLSLIKNSLKVLKEDKKICLVGDGSRGPVFKLQPGINYLAYKSNLPIIFVECECFYSITLKKTWDKFKIPLPFSKIYIKIHDPEEIKCLF